MSDESDEDENGPSAHVRPMQGVVEHVATSGGDGQREPSSIGGDVEVEEIENPFAGDAREDENASETRRLYVIRKALEALENVERYEGEWPHLHP